MNAADSYTVKERIEQLAETIAKQLAGIISQLDVIDRKIDEKASSVRVDLLERRQEDQAKQIGQLQLAAAGVSAVSNFQRWLLGTVIALSAIGASVLVWLASTGGQHP